MAETWRGAVAVSAVTALLFAPHGLCTPLFGLGRGHTPRMCGLLLVVLVEGARLHAELEERHLALRSLTDAQRNECRPYPGANVDRALWVLDATGTVQPVYVLVAGKLPDGQFVKPRDSHLAGMGVAREHEWNSRLPERVGLLGDVRKPDYRLVRAQALQGCPAIGMSRVSVIQTEDLQRLISNRDRSVRIVEHLGATPPKCLSHGFRTRPMVVIPEDGEHRRVDLTDHVG